MHENLFHRCIIIVAIEQSIRERMQLIERIRALRAALEAPMCTQCKQNKKPRTATRYSALTSFLFTRCVRREICIWQIDKVPYLLNTTRKQMFRRSRRPLIFSFPPLPPPPPLALCLSCLARIEALLSAQPSGVTAWHWSLICLSLPLLSQGNYLAELFLNPPFIGDATKVAISVSLDDAKGRKGKRDDFFCFKNYDTKLVIFCVRSPIRLVHTRFCDNVSMPLREIRSKQRTSDRRLTRREWK